MTDALFRRVHIDELSLAMKIIFDRVEWMNEVGIHQWNDTAYAEVYPRQYFEGLCLAGDLFCLCDDGGDMLAVCALLRSDERWCEKPGEALYVHHLASRTSAKGAGSLLLSLAEDYAKSEGYEYMRLDSAVGNKKLEDLYTSRGYVEAGRCVDGAYEGILREKHL